jgi:uncharacterized OB-fold protein
MRTFPPTAGSSPFHIVHGAACGVAGRRCSCGALAEPHRPACTKCQARARWTRRKARHDGIGDDP